MDNLYNPDTMSKEDIKALFVARQALLKEMVSLIKNQPHGAGVQHALIISPRGMGKTTMLLMLQFAVEDSKELSKEWQAVRFPEESYDITELADFWLKVLRYLGDATNDATLESKIAEIESRFTKSEELREAAWALVKDWRKKNKKRIILLIDNFDMILSQIGNDIEQARLRDILMNDGTVMLIGCAPSYFYEITDYEQPLYNFFKIYNLNDLKFSDIQELLRRRAEMDEIENFEEILQKNKSRLRALETFTGGNPRLVLMLYRIITSSDMTEVRKGLERLLDAVTPYYKDKTEKLPPQQRKIIDQIAQYSLEKREGISPTEIAQRTRMTPNQVSSQLKRLAENGYVRALNIRGRNSFYVLSEPLYVIWAQMRFGRTAREKRGWLVQILKAIFDIQEIQKEIEKLGERVKKFKLDGRNNKARGTLEYMLCLLETNPILMQNNFPLAVEGYLELQEIPSLKAELTVERLTNLPSTTLERLSQEGVINSHHSFLITLQRINGFFNGLEKYVEEKREVEALNKLNEVTVLMEKTTEDYKNVGSVLYVMSVFYMLKGNILLKLDNYDSAIVQYDKSIESLDESLENTEPPQEIENALFLLYLMKLNILLFQNKYNEAIESFKKYIDTVRKKRPENWIEISTSNLAQALDSKDIREIIQLADFEEEFFPLVRAIDYLETKDETLIEKLSPEVRTVVEETIRTLQMTEQDKE